MQAIARMYVLTAPAKRTADGLCPVRLCITHKRVRKYYSIAEKIKNRAWLALSPDKGEDGKTEIDRVFCDSPRGKYRDIAFEYKRIIAEAETTIGDLKIFSFNLFEDKFYNKVASWDNVFSAFWGYIEELKEDNRHGYASSLTSTLRAVKEFHTGKVYKFNPRKDKVESRKAEYLSGKPLYFVDITVSWLKRFEKWLQEKDKSKSTIGIYTRNIRVLFNLAIKKHKIKADYPFAEYKPKSADGRKIALTADQISQIANYKTDHPSERYFRDLFMLSFFGYGINLADISRLKYSNIQDGEICFVREKTKNEKGKETVLHIPLTKNLQQIIDRHGVKAVGHDAYIFPILEPQLDEQSKYNKIKQVTKQFNKYIGNIAKDLKIKEHVTSYTARHSWATLSKNSGTSIEFIKEALGHSSSLVTENYLKSFEKSTRVEHSKKMEELILEQNKAV